MIATMGGLMFGFDIAIISGAVPFIQAYFGWTELELGWGVSSLLMGAIFGAFGSGILTDLFGRKKVLIFVALFFALSCAMTAISTSPLMFVLSRIFGGLAVGAASVLSPMYVAEVAPARNRGMLVAIYQLAIVFGIVGFFLAVLVQVSGINTVIDYAPKILLAAGVEIKNALLQTSILGLINFVFTFVAILFIDKVGRRKLYLMGSMGMAVMLVLLAISFFIEMEGIFTLVCIMLFLAFFSSCIGPVFWTLVSEIYPNRIRGKALAFASLTQWIFNFLAVLLFPHFLASAGGAATFLFLALMSFTQWLFTFLYVPETKGKSLEEIEHLWTK